MALVPIISQSWDTTSVFNPTRMNNIETNIATLSNATGIKYSNGVSVKDKIDNLENGVSLLSIPANTYNTWALALQALNVEYNKLTTEQKKRCSIIRSDDIVYKCSAISSAFTSVYAGSTTKTIIQSLFLASGIFLSHNLEGATISTDSWSNNAQNYKIELRIN